MDVSEEHVASIFGVEEIKRAGKWYILSTLKMEVTFSSETFVITRTTRRHILEETVHYFARTRPFGVPKRPNSFFGTSPSSFN
jgi:hypothetical protein